MELGYCSDSSHTSAHHRKEEQHFELIRALRNTGWKVQYHIILITTSGIIFKSVLPHLSALGIPTPHHTIPAPLPACPLCSMGFLHK
jgi:hypothetical protein